MAEVEMTMDEICKPRKPGHVIFPEQRNMTTAIGLCRKMKATVSEVKRATEQTIMDKIYNDFFPNNTVEGNI